nr:MAG TPA: hypothetical protein [Caudoviricetes sp.]
MTSFSGKSALFFKGRGGKTQCPRQKNKKKF